MSQLAEGETTTETALGSRYTSPESISRFRVRVCDSTLATAQIIIALENGVKSSSVCVFVSDAADAKCQLYVWT